MILYDYLLALLKGLPQVLILPGVCFIAYIIFWKMGVHFFKRFRIDGERDKEARGQIRRELRNTMFNLLGTLILTSLLAPFARSPLTAYTPWTFIFSAVGLFVLNDFWFYWCHRALHHPLLFKTIHHVHHQSKVVSPFTSYSFHMLDGILLTACVIPVVLFLPVDMRALAFLQFYGAFNNVMSHLGYELLPPKLLNTPFLRYANTATYHALHHLHFTSNYGLSTRVWDRLFKTEHQAYERAFRAKRVRPSLIRN